MLVEFSHSTELTAKKGGCKNLKDSRPRRKIKDSKRSMPLHFIPWCVVLLKFKKGKIWPCCIVWTHFLHITIQNRINRWDSRVDPPTVLASSKQRSAPEDFDSCDGVGRILGSTRIYRGKNPHQGDLVGFFFSIAVCAAGVTALQRISRAPKITVKDLIKFSIYVLDKLCVDIKKNCCTSRGSNGAQETGGCCCWQLFFSLTAVMMGTWTQIASFLYRTNHFITWPHIRNFFQKR